MLSIGTPLWRDAAERANAYRSLFSGPTGEAVLEDLKRTLGWYRTTFDANPHVAAFNEGQRAVVVAIANTIAAKPQPQETETDESDV